MSAGLLIPKSSEKGVGGGGGGGGWGGSMLKWRDSVYVFFLSYLTLLGCCIVEKLLLTLTALFVTLIEAVIHLVTSLRTGYALSSAGIFT